MLQLLNSTVAMTLALCYLVLLLFGPILAAVWLWRMGRDVHRIADAIDFNTGRATLPPISESQPQEPQPQTSKRRIAFSAFGR